MDHKIKEIENYAESNNVPIMQKDGIEYLTNYIKTHNVKRILEIGSAIGYSAIKMCLVGNDITVTTIERDEERYQQALKNIKEFDFEDRIHIIHDDAFEVELDDQFDLIFIDAAKSQYIKFFEKFKKNLSKNGAMISDNLSFHGYTKMEQRIESKNLRQLVGKIRSYITFLQENKEFDTTFYEIGDGISVSTWKENA